MPLYRFPQSFFSRWIRAITVTWAANDVLNKPFRIRDLYERLRRVVSADGVDAGERSGRESARKDATMNSALNVTCWELNQEW